MTIYGDNLVDVHEGCRDGAQERSDNLDEKLEGCGLTPEQEDVLKRRK